MTRVRERLREHPKMQYHAGEAVGTSWPPSIWVWSGSRGRPDTGRAVLERVRLEEGQSTGTKELFIDVRDEGVVYSGVVPLDPDTEFKEFLKEWLEGKEGMTVDEIGALGIVWPSHPIRDGVK